MAEQPREYLIRKGGFFYRPNAQGYTSSVHEAGLFTEAEAIKHSHPNGPHGPRDCISYHHRSAFPALARAIPVSPDQVALLADANEDLSSINAHLVATLKNVRSLVIWKLNNKAIAKIDEVLAVLNERTAAPVQQTAAER